MSTTEVFERRESAARMYCRDVPVVFRRAQGSEIYGEDERRYLDFFAGAGALNYGHNDPEMAQAMIDHLGAQGVVHGLDLHTTYKRDFLSSIEEHLLGPRGWDYRVQFTGPTGADANEAALKLARKATGRTTIIAFNGGYHGMTAGALAVSGSRAGQRRIGALTDDVIFVPYEDGPLREVDSMTALERLVDDARGGVELPAAVIVEPVQIQAGVYSASDSWLRELWDWTRKHGIVLIVDEVQSGCGRTGDFFAFESSGIEPDIVTCAKSIGGFGMPMALALIRSELDVWRPGEHTGTFRGNQLAFLTAQIALRRWSAPGFTEAVDQAASVLKEGVRRLASLSDVRAARERGLIAGIDFGRGRSERARDVQRLSLERGLLVERCGPEGEVIKLMPPITTPQAQLEEGLGLLEGTVLAG